MSKLIVHRLVEVINSFYKGNKAAFAREMGYNKSTLSTMIKREGNPSTEFVTKILSTHTEVNARWFLLGVGKMLESQEDSNGEAVSRNEVSNLRKEVEYLKENNSQLKESNDQLKEINSYLKQKLEDLTSSSK